MPAQRGNIYETRAGYGIRWREGDQRRFQSGFRTKTEARTWFREQVAPRLHRGAPSAEIPFDDFAELFLQRHTGAPRTIATLRDRLAPARKSSAIGRWPNSTRRERHRRCRATVPAGSRYRLTNALRQVFAAAQRWRYISRNPAVDMGPNPQPRAEEIDRSRSSKSTCSPPSSAPFTARWSCSSPRPGCAQTNGSHWSGATSTGLVLSPFSADSHKDGSRRIRRPSDLAGGSRSPAGRLKRSRRYRRGSTPRSCSLPREARISAWIRGAPGVVSGIGRRGIKRRGPYCLRHTFATEALAAGISTFELSRLMGSSIEMIERTYGHLARDSEQQIRARLEARSGQMGVKWASE